jgi:hypothetical protein
MTHFVPHELWTDNKRQPEMKTASSLYGLVTWTSVRGGIVDDDDAAAVVDDDDAVVVVDDDVTTPPAVVDDDVDSLPLHKKQRVQESIARS